MSAIAPTPRLTVPRGTCFEPVQFEGKVVVARCGWPTYQEGTLAFCTRPQCVHYAPRAKELQALAVQLDLTEAVEKLTKLIEEKIR